jgi:hypothetical protein
MQKSSVWSEVLPFGAGFFLLIAATIVVDRILHVLNLVWVGRYLGIVGTVVIALSFVYSLRKHKIISIGSPPVLLRWHEQLAWVGSLMILVHGGAHYNAILPWLALVAMLVAVASGLTGKYLLKKSRALVATRQDKLVKSGLGAEEVAREIFWQSTAVDLMKQWRAVHLPITLLFALLSLAHIATILMFWAWR